MKHVRTVIALIAVACGSPCAAADGAMHRQVVFVCEHGNVKSLMAASYFNQLAEQQGLPFRALSRGSAPDSSAKIGAAEAAAAERVVTIGTELPDDARADPKRVEHWNDVPPVSSDSAAARASLETHVADLIERLRRAGE